MLASVCRRREPRRWAWTRPAIPCTVHASLLGIPAISLPVPQDEGLPLGLQIAGFVNGDAQIFAIAAAIKPLFRAASEATGRSPREVTERRRALTLRRR